MPQDRLQFEEIKLANGITVYRRFENVAYTRINITVPVGTIHNTGSVIPGTAHFLEHLIYEHADETKQQNDFSRKVGLMGGWANAFTRVFETTFELSVPTRNLAEVLPDYVQLIFHPEFTEKNIELHRGIIKNERDAERPWYPASTERGQYLETQWKAGQNYPIEQLFGGDNDLDRISVAYLHQFHKNYLDPRIRVVIAGSGNTQYLLDQLAALSVQEHRLAEALILDTWNKREYHTKAYDDLNRYEYYLGGFSQPRPAPEVVRATNFILNYLTNSIHGPLHTWLRNEQGWAYETSYASTVTRWIHDWSLYLPVSSHDQVNSLRKELIPRIETALRDANGLAAEVDRIVAVQESYPYETVESVVEDFESLYNSFGRPINETSWLQYTGYCRDPEWVWNVYQYAFAPERIGEVCFTPLEDEAAESEA